jgi:hypothetical protein
MNEFLYAVAGILIGALARHFLSKSKDGEQLDIKKGEKKEEALQAMELFVINLTDLAENASLLAVDTTYGVSESPMETSNDLFFRDYEASKAQLLELRVFTPKEMDSFNRMFESLEGINTGAKSERRRHFRVEAYHFAERCVYLLGIATQRYLDNGGELGRLKLPVFVDSHRNRFEKLQEDSPE